MTAVPSPGSHAPSEDLATDATILAPSPRSKRKSTRGKPSTVDYSGGLATVRQTGALRVVVFSGVFGGNGAAQRALAAVHLAVRAGGPAELKRILACQGAVVALSGTR